MATDNLAHRLRIYRLVGNEKIELAQVGIEAGLKLDQKIVGFPCLFFMRDGRIVLWPTPLDGRSLIYDVELEAE